VKRRLGYYRVRAAVHRPAFERALRPTDVFLVGHPKSGNTWLAYMLAVLLEPDEPARVDLLNVGRYIPFVHGRDHRIAAYAALPDPRVFRNEYPRYRDLYPRTIYLVRDPRAVLPSLWEMYRTMLDDRSLSLEAFLDQYLVGHGVFRYWNSDLERWDRQVDRALAAADRDPRILVVRYEDLEADRAAAIERAASFAAIPVTPARLAAAATLGAFDAMRRLEDRRGAEAYHGRARGDGRFVRRGRADGWRDELPPALAARIEALFGPAMRRAGYQTG
jgi:hypothetical protein